jgi:hypothetical protein
MTAVMQCNGAANLSAALVEHATADSFALHNRDTALGYKRFAS